MKTLLMLICILFLNTYLSGFSIKPSIFEIDCNGGNRVTCQYELKCTKNVPEFINIEYNSLSGVITSNQIVLPKIPIILKPDSDVYKLNILIKTPLEGFPENILKISFYDNPVKHGSIAIGSMISTKVYLRYKNKAKVDYDVDKISFYTKISKKGRKINYLKVLIKNKGNVYLKPTGKITLKNTDEKIVNIDNKGNLFTFFINQFKKPVYAGRSRELKSEIDSIPDPGLYNAEMLLKDNICSDKKLKFKIRITENRNIIILK